MRLLRVAGARKSQRWRNVYLILRGVSILVGEQQAIALFQSLPGSEICAEIRTDSAVEVLYEGSPVWVSLTEVGRFD